MPNLTSVGVSSGVPNSGTGTVSTLDGLAAILATLATAPFAKVTDGTNTAAVKAASTAAAAADPAVVVAISPNGLTRGAGAADASTLRVTVDNTQTEGSAYETVAASQSTQVIGSTGAIGDYLSHVIVSPGVAACGVVTIFDNATSIVAFPGGGTTALSNLIPFIIPVGITSTSGAWKITTGANVTCAAVGRFT